MAELDPRHIPLTTLAKDFGQDELVSHMEGCVRTLASLGLKRALINAVTTVQEIEPAEDIREPDGKISMTCGNLLKAIEFVDPDEVRDITDRGQFPSLTKTTGDLTILLREWDSRSHSEPGGYPTFFFQNPKELIAGIN